MARTCLVAEVGQLGSDGVGCLCDRRLLVRLPHGFELLGVKGGRGVRQHLGCLHLPLPLLRNVVGQPGHLL